MSLTKIQESARGEDCTLRVPGVCSRDPSTVVLCHAPYPGRFGSRKDDWWAAYGCADCHDALDGRDWASMDNYMYNSAGFWMPAIHETQSKLIDKGLMEVKK